MLLPWSGQGIASDLEGSLNTLMQNVRSAVVAVEAYRPALLGGASDQGDVANANRENYKIIISSGVLLEGGRHVVTIASGVDGCDSVVIRLQSGKRVPASLHGQDPNLNVALLEVLEDVEAPATLPKGPAVDELLDRKGWVATLGYSWGGNEPLFTVGRLTGLSYTRSGQRTMGLLRTTAPIFAGCSGGALVDLEGRWVGLLSGSCVLESDVGSISEDFFMAARPQAALALPVDQVLATVDRLRSQVRADVGFLGVRIQPDAQREDSTGVKVLEVIKRCPAHTAGLAEGDVILKIDGSSVVGSDVLKEFMIHRKPGDTTVVEILRDGQVRVLEIELGSRVRFEQQVQALEREKIQQKQLREQIQRLQEMLARMGGTSVSNVDPPDASPPVEPVNSNSP
jgi:S1-C subfamily serine protease